MLQWGRALLSAEGRVGGTQAPGRDDASMGPRSAERGRPPAAAQSASATPLQWGRALLSAEGVRPAIAGVIQHPASMGPRSAERGRADVRAYAGAVHAASMGPRSAERGSPDEVTLRTLNQALQWGR